MAKVTDVPREHRDIAGRFKHLDSMPAEEARHRARHIHELEQRCPTTGELRDLTFAHVARLASALPVAEYFSQIENLNQLAAELPGTGIDSARHDAYRAVDQIRQDNIYGPGLLAACERYLTGKDAQFDDCDIAAVLGATEEDH